MEDMTGKVLNRQKVIEIVEGTKRPILWNVRCLNCGAERTNNRANFLKGYGCKTCSMLAKGQAGLNRLFRQYKRQAKNRGFQLTLEDLKFLSGSNCHYCGVVPQSVIYGNSPGTWSEYMYNGIDRKDNTQDYVLTNCVSCCWRCNRTFGPLFDYEEKLILAEALRKIDRRRQSQDCP
jgi:hypothetical protein